MLEAPFWFRFPKARGVRHVHHFSRPYVRFSRMNLLLLCTGAAVLVQSNTTSPSGRRPCGACQTRKCPGVMGSANPRSDRAIRSFAMRPSPRPGEIRAVRCLFVKEPSPVPRSECMRRPLCLLAAVLLIGNSAPTGAQDKTPEKPQKAPNGVYAVLRD